MRAAGELPMRILFVAPLPPPVNGQAVVSQRLLDHLRERHDVTVVNIRKRSLRDGLDSAGRVVEVLGTLCEVVRHRRRADVVYITIAESLAGNIKDLLICLLVGRRTRIYVHLHGGSIRRLLYDRYKSVHSLNKLIFGRLAGAIVSGPSHHEAFDGIVDPGKVHIAANYAGDELFTTRHAIGVKFADLAPIRILYISHMTEGKGYQRLAQGFFRCAEATKRAIVIDFAGAFGDVASKSAFLESIRDQPRLIYHGVVDSERKISLFRNAHVFCLPSSLLEGQPISILEAYAAGCVVIATGQPGIRDVFVPGANGYELEQNTPDGIARTLDALVGQGQELERIALHNRCVAERDYSAATSMARISRILEHAEPA
jgi:glycosyltransferase involved in cell wall biosynthesis